MRHSIRSKLIVLVVGLIAGCILACIILNMVFLNRFYKSGKLDDMKDIFETVEIVLGNDDGLTTDETLILTGVCEKYGVSLLLSDNTVGKVYTYGDSNGILTDRLKDVHENYAKTGNFGGRIVENGNDYIIIQYYDYEMQSSYYELYSKLDSDMDLFVRMGLENVSALAFKTNKFFAIMGGIVILISIIIVAIVAYGFSYKLLKLVNISKKMTNMEFDVRYEIGNWDDEVDVLGINMNKMADELEKNIHQLKEANIKLEHDIKKKEELEEMRTEFLSNVSHELKTPLAIIQGYAEGLKEGINDDSESREFYCDVIIDEANKMNLMVKQLLSLSHLENSKDSLEKERFDIIEVINQRIISAGRLLKQKDVKIEFDSDREMYVFADEFKIEEVITNYLSNAINHVDGENVIRITAEHIDDVVRVEVFNTGENISDKDINNIWDKFYKIDKARTREYGGSGIGLSIVKAVMNSHQNKFGVKNEENGVTFWFEVDFCQ
ncbi:MAG: GHKL domain-containing protein [Lachnospiraceae bacterium]|nr:GHKL domain-containing protein [Lachnospiraceae bacterium]